MSRSLMPLLANRDGWREQRLGLTPMAIVMITVDLQAGRQAEARP